MPRQRRWQPNERLAYERERRGWSQDDAAQEAEKVADRLGQPDLVFTGAQFGRWERGESRPRPPLRRVVCELYDASAEALGLLDQGDATANRRTAIKAITVMGGLGALSGRRLLTDAADAAVAASRKRARVDPMTLESSTRTSSDLPWTAWPSRMPTCSRRSGTTGSRSSASWMLVRALRTART
jgi:transcriptional regulator with XRE-family HTH domain